MRAKWKIWVPHPGYDIQKNLSEYLYVNYACIETFVFDHFGGVIFINIMFCYCLITRHTKILIALV